MCSLSFALGHWRGCFRLRLLPRDVPLAPAIDVESYRAGFARGREERATTPRPRR